MVVMRITAGRVLKKQKQELNKLIFYVYIVYISRYKLNLRGICTEVEARYGNIPHFTKSQIKMVPRINLPRSTLAILY